MKKTIIAALCLLLCFTVVAQKKVERANYPFAQWEAGVLEKANPAKNTPYLDATEKQVIYYTNLARANGKLFFETFVQFWVDSTGYVEKRNYLPSLKKDLASVINLPMLQPADDLTKVAVNHAKAMGKSGKTGHKDFNKRMKPLMQKTYNLVAENCDYGRVTALDIVMSLLIDEGVPDLGHRKSMLNPKLNAVGIGIAKHKVYRTNCVMDFGGK
jgi:hypothetical protein